ncbi:putative membrane protein [Oikeobacillus pervagus]|uniref:Membrane protein n=1 Tax=Oikeobacillus pervagus TaxID=1325931 RepID=A0AAJ1T0X8_9BACI|nr:YwiC-like family protein [Oikeobacillus pervagus]MDQ0216625.1 putative membrane protein [Oikeobacillus pervagus]
MKPLIPNQHGAWAMLIIPFFLGIIISGGTWLHIPLFIAWFFLYLGTYPLLMNMKKKKKRPELTRWGIFYLSIAFVMITIVLIYQWRMVYFGLAMLPFFLVNLYFTKKKRERALWNDFSAILSFCIGGMASYYVGSQQVDSQCWMIGGISFLFFVGSTFYVKTMIREKKNVVFHRISWGYHIGIVLLFIFLREPFLFLAFFPSLLRAIMMVGRKISTNKIGVLEITNSVYMFLLVLVYFYQY